MTAHLSSVCQLVTVLLFYLAIASDTFISGAHLPRVVSTGSFDFDIALLIMLCSAPFLNPWANTTTALLLRRRLCELWPSTGQMSILRLPIAAR